MALGPRGPWEPVPPATRQRGLLRWVHCIGHALRKLVGSTDSVLMGFGGGAEASPVSARLCPRDQPTGPSQAGLRSLGLLAGTSNG